MFSSIKKYVFEVLLVESTEAKPFVLRGELTTAPPEHIHRLQHDHTRWHRPGPFVGPGRAGQRSPRSSVLLFFHRLTCASSPGRSGEADRLQLRRPRRGHSPAGLAAFQRLFARPLVVDPSAELRVLLPALWHVAVIVPLPIGLELGQLRLPPGIVPASFALSLADRGG